MSKPRLSKRAKKKHVLVYLCTLQAVKWRNTWDVLAPILVDGNLVFSTRGLEIHGVTHTQCVKCDLNAFEEYEFNMSSPVSIGVNFENFFKMFKGAKEEDIIRLEITDDSLHGPNPHISTEILSDGVTIRGKLSILDIESVSADMPPVRYDSVLEVLSFKFQMAVRLHSEHGETCQILNYHDPEGENDILFFHTPGDFSSLTTCLRAQESSVSQELENERKSSDKKESYKLHDLNLICKATPLSKYVTIYLKEDYPFILEYKVGTLGFMRFALASRIEPGEITLKDIDIEAHRVYMKKKKEKEEAEEAEEERNMMVERPVKSKIIRKKKTMTKKNIVSEVKSTC